MVLVIIEVEDGLMKYRNMFPGGPESFFTDLLQEIFIAKNVIYTLQTLLGDGVVVGSFFICQCKALAAYRTFLSDKRFIDVMSFGNLSGLSSYHACCGAVSQVSLQYQDVVGYNVVSKPLVFVGSTHRGVAPRSRVVATIRLSLRAR
jgi:hypothetical protein